MANSFAYASIEKTNKNDDGTLTVYGKATDDSLDIDQQICDSDWLKKAMPEWMVSGGNVREQHSSIAAGVATEYEEKNDGHYITALVVDPVSVKKVETGVLKGFSIGIKGPRVVRDTKAAGGRIIDGQIVEISLVDRPANPNAKLILAKSVGGDLVKYDPDQERDESGRFGSGGGSSSESSVESVRDKVGETFDQVASLREDSEFEPVFTYFQSANDALREIDSSNGDERNKYISQAQSSLRSAADFLESKEYTDEAKSLRDAHRALSEMKNKSSIPTPKDVAAMVNKNADPVEPVEEATEEVVEETELTEAEQVEKAAQLLNLTKTFTAELVKFDQGTFDRAKRELANLIIVEANEMADMGHDERNSLSHLLESVEHLFAWYEGEMSEGEVGGTAVQEIMMAADADEPAMDGEAEEEVCEKCGETMKMCKCADKALDGDEEAEEAEEDSTEKSLDIDEATTVAIIEKAVTQAKESVKEEIGLLKSALEAEKAKASQIADELATAKKAVAGGGPKRAVTDKPDHNVDTLLQKAAEYSVKASVTTDPILAKGYRELAEEMTTKASRKDVNTNV